MTIAFPGESAEYRAARERLLEQEIEMRRAMEAGAAARRAPPPGGRVARDYVFAAADGAVRLPELFAGHDALVVYHMMFPRDPGDTRPGAQDGPCPSCVSFLDQLDGAAEHVAQNTSFVVVAKAPVERVLGF